MLVLELDFLKPESAAAVNTVVFVELVKTKELFLLNLGVLHNMCRLR